MICDSLMVSSLDEVSTDYGLIAEAVSHPPDFASTTFRLRPEARHHDGKPITVEDVIFSFESFKKHNPMFAAYYRHVVKVEQTGEREVTFTFDGPGNREMPVILGQLEVLPKHWWEGTDAAGKKRDIGATTLEPPLGNGAYRIKEFVAGRTVVYERVKDYWAKDLNVNVGRDNFDEIRFEYFRDATVALEAFKADHVDWRTENSAKNWATAYDFPAVKDKRVVLEEFPDAQPRHHAGLRVQHAARQVQGRAGAARVQFRLRFRGDEQADLLRPVQAHQQLLRGHRACLLRAAAGAGAGDPRNRARQGAARGLHDRLYQSGRRRSARRCAPICARRCGCCARPATRCAIRSWSTPRPASRSTVEILDRGSERRALHPVLQALARAPRHHGERPHRRRRPIREPDAQLGLRHHRSRPGRSRCRPATSSATYWSSQAADTPGSRNYVGIKNPAVDALIERVIFAKDRAELVAATRALDRVLLWNHYVVPQFTYDMLRTARWDRFGRPEALPKYGAAAFPTIWWWDAEKAAKTGTRQ